MMHILRFLLILLVGSSHVLAKSPPPGTGKADVPANILFMLDTSGSMGSWSGTYFYPSDVAVDSSGNIYMLEQNYHRIRKYSPTGSLLWTRGSYGSGTTGLRYPYKISLDAGDNLYIADYYNGRIVKWNSSGGYVRQFTGVSYPRAVDVAPNGDVFATNGSVAYRWNGSGALLSSFRLSQYSYGLSVDATHVYTSGYDRIYKYEHAGSYVSNWQVPYFGRYIYDIEVTSHGVYAASYSYSKILKYNTTGSTLSSWGSYGTGNSQFRYLYGIGSDSSGSIFAADYYNYAIKKFDKNGVYISTPVGSSGGSRLDQLKKVIKRIVSSSDLTSGANFGLMKWHSYAQMLVNISSSGASQVYRAVDSLYASGGTNLDNAMSLAQQYFNGSSSPINRNASCQKNILIVMSDGYWYDSRASRIAQDFNSRGIKTFVIGFATAGNSNYVTLSQKGGTYPESPLYSSNWQHLYETLSNYIRQAISSRLTFTSPAVMPSVSGGTDHILQASFKYKADHQWEGHLIKYKLNADGSVGDKVWDAGEKLDAKNESSRQVWTEGRWTGISAGLNNFVISNQSDLEFPLYEGSGKTPTSTELSNLIQFVRGVDVYDEDADGNTSEKRWKLGDIYHSSPIVVGKPNASTTSDSNSSNTESYYRYQKNYSAFANGNACGGGCPSRKEVVYAGSNDGMLHAFDSSNGDELWGFIPPNLLPSLRNMDAAMANSSHSIYGVDATPVVKDIYYGNQWRTVLLAGLGRGGHGYFALDVTNPTAPSFLFAFSNHPLDQVVRYWDSAGSRSEFSYAVAGSVPSEYDFSKLGEAWSVPQIFLMPDGSSQKWVAVFGAGFNGGVNTSYGSAIYVIDLENGGKLLKQIALSDSSSNIANAVPADLTLVTADSTSRAKYKGALAYVADLESKVWKINFSDKGTLYEATQIFDGQGTHENDRFSYFPVTLSIGGDGKLWIYYGTGDQQRLQRMSSTIQNRVFGVKDLFFPDFKSVNSKTIASLKNTSSAGASCPSDADLGWYIDLKTNEKVTGKLAVSNETIFASRYTPNTSNICNPGTGRLSEHDYACGNSFAGGVHELGSGIPTGAVIYKGRIYLGISGAASNGTLPQGWTRKDNLLVGASVKGASGAGTATIESWRELF
jgi:type IV pilus assembly protein PilY1